MEHASPLTDPALTIGLALVAGMVAQALARHLRVPGIVLLLGAGVALGPDVANVVRPETLGPGLQTLVGFAVAIILFEGGLSLKWSALRREARSIRQIVTAGAVVTAVGGSLVARYILGWEWTVAVLFGTLIIVTGPTVIQPLLRRIRVQKNLSTVLEAEGVFGDAIGAIVAIVALEVVLVGPSGESLAMGALQVGERLGLGALMGLVGGSILIGLLRFEHVIPAGLENVFTLSLVVALFQVSNAVVHESGIVAVTIAGLAVGNAKSQSLSGVRHDLKEFKEQLTVLFIGMLFVLLAADVRLEEVQSLGRNGLLAVAAVMFLVRPLNVAVGTWGSDFNLREKAFLSWLAPRGIVAAAVASLFAIRLDGVGIDGGSELRSMVFLVIAATVLVQGLSGGVVARLLGVRPDSGSGYVILGVTALSRALARLLRKGGQEVVFIDSNPTACRTAEDDGYRVLYGSALADTVLQRAELDHRAGCIGATANENVNYSFGRRVRREFRTPAWIALQRKHHTINESMVAELGGRTLFGRAQHLVLWNQRAVREEVRVEAWKKVESPASAEELRELFDAGDAWALPLTVQRRGRCRVVDERTSARKGDVLHVMLLERHAADATSWLEGAGWSKVDAEPESSPRDE